jgi:hypothetical protein
MELVKNLLMLMSEMDGGYVKVAIGKHREWIHNRDINKF